MKAAMLKPGEEEEHSASQPSQRRWTCQEICTGSLLGFPFDCE